MVRACLQRFRKCEDVRQRLQAKVGVLHLENNPGGSHRHLLPAATQRARRGTGSQMAGARSIEWSLVQVGNAAVFRCTSQGMPVSGAVLPALCGALGRVGGGWEESQV